MRAARPIAERSKVDGMVIADDRAARIGDYQRLLQLSKLDGKSSGDCALWRRKRPGMGGVRHNIMGMRPRGSGYPCGRVVFSGNKW